MSDWADDRAREWLEGMDEDDFTVANVSALLREVQGTTSETAWIATRQQVLAEVRRVVCDVRDGWKRSNGGPPPADDITATGNEILARLEKL